MTQKELLYTMDAVNHLKHLTDMCNTYKCEDLCKETKGFICSLLTEAIDGYKTMTNLVCTKGAN